MASNCQLNLMAKILNIPEFTVQNYKTIEEIGLVIYVESKKEEVICPCCGKITDKLHQNHWSLVRDLPWAEQKVYLKINRRQMKCEKCQKLFSEEFNSIKIKKKYTERFINKIIEEVLGSDIKNVAQRHELSEEEIQTMLRNKGDEIIEKKPQKIKRLGLDEIALVKGQKNYCAVLVDLDKNVIVGLLENRTESAIAEYLESWGQEVLEQIKEVSIDMWKPYKSLVNQLMPQAEVVVDRFHVMKQVNDELDSARKKTKREANKLKNKKKKEKILSGIKKSKYVLLKNQDELTDSEKEKLQEIAEVAPDLARKHQLKEEFRNIFEKNQDWVEGLLALSDWLKDANSDFTNSCGTIKRWIGEIIAYFDRRTTQGAVEGINNKLKLIKRRAYGFRNFENFELRSFLTWHFAS